MFVEKGKWRKGAAASNYLLRPNFGPPPHASEATLAENHAKTVYTRLPSRHKERRERGASVNVDREGECGSRKGASKPRPIPVTPLFFLSLLNEDVAGKYRVTKELSDRLDSSLGGTCLEPSGYKQDTDDRVFLDKVVNLGEKT